VPLASRRLAFHAGNNAVDEGRALELGEDAEHLDHHPTSGATGVERLGRAPEEHSGLVQFVEDLGEAADRPSESVYAVDEEEFEASCAGVGQGTLEIGSF